MGMGLAKIIPKWPIVSGWLWWNPAKSHPTNDNPPRNWTPTSTDLPTFLVLPTKLRGWTSGKCKAWTSLEIPLGSDRFFASFLQDLKVIFAQKGPIQVLRVSFKVLILEWTWVNFHELCGPWWYFFYLPSDTAPNDLTHAQGGKDHTWKHLWKMVGFHSFPVGNHLFVKYWGASKDTVLPPQFLAWAVPGSLGHSHGDPKKALKMMEVHIRPPKWWLKPPIFHWIWKMILGDSHGKAIDSMFSWNPTLEKTFKRNIWADSRYISFLGFHGRFQGLPQTSMAERVETVETTNDNGGWKLGVALKCSWPMDTIFGQPRNCRRSVGTVGGGGTHSHNTR